MKKYLGIGKTIFHSSASLISVDEEHGKYEVELLLSERFNRKKASGVWPELPLKLLSEKTRIGEISIAENRDVNCPRKMEHDLNLHFPFYEYLQAKNLNLFSHHFNKNIDWVSHHLCHANMGAFMSPFSKALIVVVDGAGSRIKDFSETHPERKFFKHENALSAEMYLEESSVYSLDNGEINCLEKNWQNFNINADSRWYSEGLGSYYETIAEYIFNDKQASGKVMGLAGFGNATQFESRSHYLMHLDWSKAFKGNSKSEWENSGRFYYYADIAATAQKHFEQSTLDKCIYLRKKYPDYENLILVGGCALNCTTNMKIYNKEIFKSIYVPPFPGDESIGLGAACWLMYKDKNKWKKHEWDGQKSSLGYKNSIPSDEEIEQLFSDYTLLKSAEIQNIAAQKIADNKIIAWFQGRSETGPRALGSRSILARVDQLGVKEKLNKQIKKREDFRPYGCSILFERVNEYFQVPPKFEAPFMSFAVYVKNEFQKKFKEVTHIDGTSRFQTVRSQQNELFYKLIQSIGELTGTFAVLNTSMNVMGEPIVENIKDAKRFFETTMVDGMVIGNYFIQRKE